MQTGTIAAHLLADHVKRLRFSYKLLCSNTRTICRYFELPQQTFAPQRGCPLCPEERHRLRFSASAEGRARSAQSSSEENLRPIS